MRKLAVLTAVALGTIVLASACGGGGKPTVAGKIAFYSDRDGNIEVYIMNADGSGQTRLTNNLAEDGLPDWSPVP